ncbi:MAG: hypothetical protein HYX92_08430 [Chloroflexi bacterium]|nr:hypothetical protein [Chloroflexota bacterium]
MGLSPGRLNLRMKRLAFVLAVGLGLGLVTSTVWAQVQTYSCPTGFGEVVVPLDPLFLMTSLKTVPNPVFPGGALRADLAEYIASPTAAIQLGKALFWDMQAGSDNKTACATCHFQAGADSRARNQLHPGANGLWDSGYGPNYTLAPGDFPFTDTGRDIDNIAGSQGVRKSTFQGIGRAGVEQTASVADPLFSAGGKNVRQVTGMNTPSTINAVFNHRNFWNGRAQPEFNGVNPWGGRDLSARVWMVDLKGNPANIDVHIQNASLASQAVGPPLNTVEMSAEGRTFPDIGKKMLLSKPLGLQKVAGTDSVLGALADTTAGIKTSYKTLIQQAFQPKWWDSTKKVTVNGKSYSVMEANFSLFWGLSIMLYEATLVSDDSPMDRYLASRVLDTFGTLITHDPTLLDPVVDRVRADYQAAFPGQTLTRDNILNGLALFERPVPPPPFVFPPPAGTGVGCIACHLGAETTGASLQNLAGHGLEPGDAVLRNAGFDLRMERMFMLIPPVPPGTDQITFDTSNYAVMVTSINGTPVSPPRQTPTSVYDAGWYNIGVRPTADDPGLDGKDPFGKFLSWTRLFQALVDPTFIKVPGGGLGCLGAGNASFPDELLNDAGLPLLSGPLQKSEATDAAGSFKTPSLRNVELNGPHFHNGGKSTLNQVMAFYDSGGNFRNPTIAPLIRPLGMTSQQIMDLVAFLLALTDERVLFQRAPFDHPELVVPSGQNADGSDIAITLPAVGASGAATPLERFQGRNPFSAN